MRKDMLLQVQSEGGIDEVTAVHAADRIGKLRQIACGVVKDTTSGEYLLLDYKPRLQTLLEAIGESLSKVIVVAPYKGIMLSLVQEIGQYYTVEMINGDTPPSKRGDIISRFRHTPYTIHTSRLTNTHIILTEHINPRWGLIMLLHPLLNRATTNP